MIRWLITVLSPQTTSHRSDLLNRQCLRIATQDRGCLSPENSWTAKFYSTSHHVVDQPQEETNLTGIPGLESVLDYEIQRLDDKRETNSFLVHHKKWEQYSTSHQNYTELHIITPNQRATSHNTRNKQMSFVLRTTISGNYPTNWWYIKNYFFLNPWS